MGGQVLPQGTQSQLGITVKNHLSRDMKSVMELIMRGKECEVWPAITSQPEDQNWNINVVGCPDFNFQTTSALCQEIFPMIGDGKRSLMRNPFLSTNSKPWSKVGIIPGIRERTALADSTPGQSLGKSLPSTWGMAKLS